MGAAFMLYAQELLPFWRRALFFSEIKMMVVLGAANLAILLIVIAVKRYAFTSVWRA